MTGKLENRFSGLLAEELMLSVGPFLLLDDEDTTIDLLEGMLPVV